MVRQGGGAFLGAPTFFVGLTVSRQESNKSYACCWFPLEAPMTRR